MKAMRLKYLARLVTDCVADGPRPFLALEHVNGWTRTLVAGVEVPVREAPEAGAATAEPGDVLFGKLRPYLAKVLLVDRPSYVSTELMCLRPAPNINAGWLSYLMCSRQMIDWAVATSDGTKMPRTSWEKMGEFRALLPDLSAQASIVELLDRESSRTQALVSAQLHMIDLLQERQQALITQTLTGGRALAGVAL